ncbi:hypothetical protein ACVWY3_004219 [Bradyrhizobium sp. USDA 4486]
MVELAGALPNSHSQIFPAWIRRPAQGRRTPPRACMGPPRNADPAACGASNGVHANQRAHSEAVRRDCACGSKSTFEVIGGQALANARRAGGERRARNACRADPNRAPRDQARLRRFDQPQSLHAAAAIPLRCAKGQRPRRDVYGNRSGSRPSRSDLVPRPPLGRLARGRAGGRRRHPSRWFVQRASTAWLGVGATTHWSAMASFHVPGTDGCAECLHPTTTPPTPPFRPRLVLGRTADGGLFPSAPCRRSWRKISRST